MNLKKYIREVPDWPIKGVNFKDITTLLQDPKIFRYVINRLTLPYLNTKVDKIVAIDARGFLLATPVAYKLRAGVCLVRKDGKLPFHTIKATYQKEYGPDTLTMHQDSIKPGDKVIIIDDLLATGGTVNAAVSLIEQLGGHIIGISVIIDLPFLGGSRLLKKYLINYLVKYDHE